MTMTKVIIVKPERLAGTVAHKSGDRFRYPGQRFWVQPVILENGQKELALQIEELPIDNKVAADYSSGFVESKITLNTNPHIVYDYYDLECHAKCPSCGSTINWISSNDSIKGHLDKFRYAECCGMQYSMVPERVRVISVPLAVLRADPSICCDEYDDENFLNELDRWSKPLS